MTAANIGDNQTDHELDLDLDIVQVDRPRDGLEQFATLLFARVAPEDLVQHQPRELSELAASAWEFLSVRTPGKPKIRITQPKQNASSTLRNSSIIEIVNDDMPFLVNSVMAELAERHVGVKLVAHPVVSSGARRRGTPDDVWRAGARRSGQSREFHSRSCRSHPR